MIYLSDSDLVLRQGDVLAELAELEDESVDCVVTSPPYWGLRDYGTASWQGGEEDCEHLDHPGGTAASTLHDYDNGLHEGSAAEKTSRSFVTYREVCLRCGARRQDEQLGLEATPELYIAKMVEVFQAVRRVLSKHGTLWLNMGDSYASGDRDWYDEDKAGGRGHRRRPRSSGDLKPKDLVGMPWELALALRRDGWWLRAENIWSKPNPMPESIVDRPTKAHEHVFLLSKAERYYYDREAVREAFSGRSNGSWAHPDGWASGPGSHSAVGHSRRQTLGDLPPEAERGADGRRETRVEAREGSHQHRDGERWPNAAGRNMRDVWTIPLQGYKEAHFATFPEELVRRCVLAGSSERGKCPDCGTPWERALERVPIGWRPGCECYAALYVRDFDRPRASKRWQTHTWYQRVRRRAVPRELGWPLTPTVVLDPFGGSGTTAVVARRHGRSSVLIELNPEYCEMIVARTHQLSLLADG